MMIAYRPLGMGLLMGPMMLWMIHGQLTGTTQSGWATAAFVGAHLLIIAALITGAVFAARLSPWMHSVLDRLHRPSLSHVTAMLVGLVVSVLVVHFWQHGVV